MLSTTTGTKLFYKFYKDEVSTLKTKNQVDKSSWNSRLYPLLHENVLCVGKRLVLCCEFFRLEIVPPESQLARLTIANAHEKTRYDGTIQVLAQIRLNVWNPANRGKIKNFILGSLKFSKLTTKATIPFLGYLLKLRKELRF